MLLDTSSWEGDDARDRFGFSVSNAGDVDGDGNLDLVAGAPQWYWQTGANLVPQGGISEDAGYVKVILGVGSGPGSPQVHTILGTQFDAGTPPETPKGEWFGFAVDTAFNVDTVPGAEILIGAPLWDDVTAADVGRSLVYGWDAGQSALVSLGANYEHKGTSLQEYFGWAVCGLGRFDCDDYTDFAVGARNFGVANDRGACADNCPPGEGDPDGGGGNCGRVWVYRGVDGDTVALYTGEDIKDHFGWAIGRIGDFDLDPLGLDDIVVGGMAWPGPMPDPDTDEYGRVYVFNH